MNEIDIKSILPKGYYFLWRGCMNIDALQMILDNMAPYNVIATLLWERKVSLTAHGRDIFILFHSCIAARIFLLALYYF